jgi:two-component system, chemotaxis family, protein-glutamate methylesterase/glutaminase
MRSPLKVLVVDDSAVSRRLLATVLDGDPELQVVGEARDGREAMRMAEQLRPDVITMDIHMPDMDGFETTRRIMESSPRPIVIVSADYDPQDVARSFHALEAGALTVLPKPHGAGTETFSDRAAELIEVVKLMAGVNVFRRHARPGRKGGMLYPAPSLNGAPPAEIVAIGASTGGPAALATLLQGLPPDLGVPVLIAQHLARGFDSGLAEWLDTVTDLDVRLAMAGEPLHAGTVLVAPHGSHLGVTRSGRATLSFSEPLGGHRPSVSYLFSSVARAYGASALGVILTGMGEDGVAGLIELKGAGGRVLGQDRASCVVYGMPRAALRAGVVDQELPPATLAAAIAAYCRLGRRR